MSASPDNNIAHRFLQLVQEVSLDAVALRERGRSMTFHDLAARSVTIASQLRGDGIGVGSRVLLLVPMSIELYAILIALFQLGAAALVVDPRAGRDHLERCCAISRPDAFIGIRKAHLLRFTTRAVRAIRRKYVVGPAFPFARRLALDLAASDSQIAALEPDASALLTFTSGSTGQPKCAVRSHRLLLAQQRALVEAIDLKPGQVDFATLPIFALSNLAAGVTTVLDDFDTPEVTRTVAAPAFLTSPHRKQPDARRMTLYTGGAPLFPSTLERIQDNYLNSRIVAVYGSTEAEPIAHFDWTDCAEADRAAMRAGKGLLAGQPVPQIEARVLPNIFGMPIEPMALEVFQQRCLTTDRPGEIVVSGDHVLKGYLNGVGDAETKFRVDGQVWHRTGDAGFLDAQGRLWLLGRASARVIDSHGEIYPFPVESIAYTSPAVTRCALVAYRGRRALVVESSADPASTRRDLTDRLASFQILQILFVKSIPLDRRHRSKIDYPALAKIVERL